ncbi:MAG: hypothetical protein FH756_11335 [Firmicutes bacterium]|nr:hypothetical protein [Bacillota bacterium]
MGWGARRLYSSAWESKGIAFYNSNDVLALTATSDGSIWATGDNKGSARWNGSSWEQKGQVFSAWDCSALALVTASDGSVWAGGQDGYTARWNGSAWESMGRVPGNNSIHTLITASDGSIWAGGINVIARWNGSSWEDKQGDCSVSGVFGMTEAPDGSIWIAGWNKISRWDGSSWKDKSNGYNIYTLTTDADGNIWGGDDGHTLRYKFDSPSFKLAPSPNGPSGKLIVNPRFDNSQISQGLIQYSTDGVNFSDLYTCQAGSKKEIAPDTNNYWFRLKWKWRSSPAFSWQAKYSNTYGPVPAITANPSVTADSGIKAWDDIRGRSWVTHDWNSITNISGYKLHIFDGNNYRSKDLGTATSWDSRTAKVFPFTGELPEDNSISTDIFRWNASGLNLEDTPIRLYRSTIKTGYNNDNRYFFRITAYNEWMESDFNASSSRVTIQLPNATDSTAPGGSITIVEVDEPNSRVTVDLSSIYDNQSGLNQVRFSNDGASYSSWQSFVTNKTWSVPSGDGTKTVYVQARDKVGNINTFSDSCFFGVTTTQLYNATQENRSYINNAKSAAEQAQIASNEARNSAVNAAGKAIEARDSANEAKAAAQNTVNQTYYSGTYGGSPDSVADVAGYIRSTQLPNVENKIDNLETVVANIENNMSTGDSAPPTITSVKGYNGATCTTGTTFKVVVKANDNNSGPLDFRIKADSGSWSNWTSISNYEVATGINGGGAHTISVEVRDQAGNTANDAITVFKI